MHCYRAHPLGDHHEALCSDPFFRGEWQDQDVLDDYVVCAGGLCSEECGTGRAWSCLDKVSVVNYQEDSLSIHFTLSGLQGPLTLPARVRACSTQIVDPECSDPIDEGVTDEAGNVTLTISEEDLGAGGNLDGFAGVFRIDAEDAEKYFPVVYTPVQPLTVSGLDRGIDIPERVIWGGGTAIAGAPLVPGTGMVSISVRDCISNQAPGVRITHNQPKAKTLYLAGTVPTSTVQVTDLSGFAAIVNIPTVDGRGSIRITATLPGEGDAPDLEVSTVDVIVEADKIVQIYLGPIADEFKSTSGSP